ncbi:MAG TPA: ATP-binding protein [Mobilitalea sp.]|nr:ATP-binding protein [Mobilitalea sp.]
MKPLEFKKILPRYKVLMDNIQEIVIIFDTRGRIIDCNDNTMNELGYGDDIFLLPVNEVFRQSFQYKDKSLVIEPKYMDGPSDTIAYRKNQTCFPASLKVMLFKDRGINLGICTAVNITDKKDAIREAKFLSKELKSLDQLNNELIANVTHELRTPINGIMGFSNSLLESELNPKQREDIKIIVKCCTNMSNIVNNILDYTKLANSKLELEQREFNFRDFINQIIQVNSILIFEKGLNLLVNISDEIPKIVIGDELRLSQVLNNLFSNAIKFTSEGHIGLEVTKTYEFDYTIELFFMLFDSGIGISPDEKEKLFKSFSQVDSSITRIFGGTGLGLSISKRLVEAMGGSIQVESEKEKGSAFSFSIRLKLPQDKKDATQAELQEEEEHIMDLATEDRANDMNESEIDYINKKLRECYQRNLQKPNDKEMMHNIEKTMKTLLEKVTICIEMENWDTAEELVSSMRKKIPQDHAEVSRKILSLLLSIRKENRESSLKLLNELGELLNKGV